MKPEEAIDYLVGIGMFTVTNINTQLVDEKNPETRIKVKALKLEMLEAIKAASKYRKETFGEGERHDPTTTPKV